MELAAPANERNVVFGAVVAKKPRDSLLEAARLLLVLAAILFLLLPILPRLLLLALEHFEGLHKAFFLLRGRDLPVLYEYPVAPLDLGVVEKLLHKAVYGLLQVLLLLAVADLLVLVRPPLYEREQEESPITTTKKGMNIIGFENEKKVKFLVKLRERSGNERN